MIKRKEFTTGDIVTINYTTIFGNERPDTRNKYRDEVLKEALDFINNHKIVSINEYSIRYEYYSTFHIVVYYQE